MGKKSMKIAAASLAALAMAGMMTGCGKPAAVHIFLLNTLCTLRLFSVYVCETLFYCTLFYALSLRENCPIRY